MLGLLGLLGISTRAIRDKIRKSRVEKERVEVYTIVGPEEMLGILGC